MGYAARAALQVAAELHCVRAALHSTSAMGGIAPYRGHWGGGAVPPNPDPGWGTGGRALPRDPGGGGGGAPPKEARLGRPVTPGSTTRSPSYTLGF